MSGARAGGGGFDARQRSQIDRALRLGNAPVCPACGATLARRPVDPPRAVAYVRHRILLVCPACHRSGGFDAPGNTAPRTG